MGGLFVMPKKFAIEQIEKFVKGNSDCKLLDEEYVNQDTKMKFQCKCGNIFETTFSRFKNKNKRQCSECGKKSRIKKRRKPHKEFCKQIYELVGNEYLVLGEYKNNCTKVLMKHNKCEHSYEVTPGNFLRGKKCPNCFGTPKKDTEQFKKEVFKKWGNEYKVLGQYKSNNLKILVEHTGCRFKWLTLPRHLLEGHGCPKCSNNIKKDIEIFKKELSKINKNIVVLGEYENVDTPIKVRCLIDGYEWKATPHNLLKGSKCPRCSKHERYTTKTYKDKVLNLYGNEYSILGNYIDSKTKILIKHNKCGHIWKAVPSSLISGYGCPKCNESKGEKKISTYLDKNNVKYITQYKFKSCKNKRELPFDFYLSEYNICIEYDGEQHFKPYRFTDKKKSFEKLHMTKVRDQIKNKYCKENNIKLVRIPYTEFNNIEIILKSVLP